ncbi:MAG: HNH endonuclease [Planctomycetaceae bacterium]|nr:HNH endonuclease [Planctomycetaceae bacterium]
MSVYIPVALRKQVLANAGGYCAYCHSAQKLLAVTFEIEHIIPRSAGGQTSESNLCLSCPTCNRHKSNRLTAKDPASGLDVPLFHPLEQNWHEHFKWNDDKNRLIGLTPTGRATIESLRINRSALVTLRGYWVALNLHPPD